MLEIFQVVESDDLLAAYTELSRTEYTWEELQVRPLPPGVDPAKIESYLNDTVFRVSCSQPSETTFFNENNCRKSSR